MKVTGGLRFVPARNHPVRLRRPPLRRGELWRGGKHGEAEVLAACYRRSLEIAVAEGFGSVAFPAISTGIYGYPVDLAAEVAVSTVRALFADRDSEMRVIFCCFSESDAAVYRRVIGVE